MDTRLAREVSRIVADQLGVDVKELRPEVSLVDDLAADSLDLVELAVVLETECDVVIADARLEDVRTYGDLLAAVATARRPARRTTFPPVFARTRIVPGRGSGAGVERAGELDPYTVEILVDEVLRAGAGARLEIEVRGDEATSAEARARFARLVARGVDVSARPAGRQTPPAA